MYKAMWTGPRAAMESAATYFTELAEDAATAVSLTRVDQPFEDGADGVWSLEAYFAREPDLAAIRVALSAIDPGWSAIDSGETEKLPDIDWVAHSLEGLGVVRAGRFALYGVHDEDRLPDEDGVIPIRIDANQAFGTGHHPTTRGCLELLDRLAGLPAENVLDLGCGSGVLAFAAAKAWGGSLLASDVDPQSIEIAEENARLNDCASMVSFVVAEGFDHAAIRARSPFDFVFANILAGPLTELAPPMANHVARHGRIMLAGLMAEQEERVVAAYQANGFRLINRIADEVWPILLLVKL